MLCPSPSQHLAAYACALLSIPLGLHFLSPMSALPCDSPATHPPSLTCIPPAAAPQP
jgi:hypothetical protein